MTETTSPPASVPAPRAPVLTCLENPIAGRHRWTQDGTRKAGSRLLPVYVCGWCDRRK